MTEKMKFDRYLEGLQTIVSIQQQFMDTVDCGCDDMYPDECCRGVVSSTDSVLATGLDGIPCNCWCHQCIHLAKTQYVPTGRPATR